MFVRARQLGVPGAKKTAADDGNLTATKFFHPKLNFWPPYFFWRTTLSCEISTMLYIDDNWYDTLSPASHKCVQAIYSNVGAQNMDERTGRRGNLELDCAQEKCRNVASHRSDSDISKRFQSTGKQNKRIGSAALNVYTPQFLTVLYPLEPSLLRLDESIIHMRPANLFEFLMDGI